jgi:23S rRNA (cytidine2498-2'-O)-methyltransferase
MQHRFPVQQTLETGATSLEALARVPLNLPQDILHSGVYAFQVSANKRLDFRLGELLPAWTERLGLSAEDRRDRQPKIVVSAFIHCLEQEKVKVYAGVSPVEGNLSPWSRGVCRIPRDRHPISRAESKLLEALELFPPFSGGRALDLGAAPGGWTRVLGERGFVVDAVDPADLSPIVRDMPNVRYHQTTAGDFLADSSTKYSLLVCDMKMDPLMVADLMTDVQPRIRPDGAMIATLKLPKKGNPLPVLEKALEKFKRAYTIVQARQLYFNRHEVTVLGQPRLSSLAV